MLLVFAWSRKWLKARLPDMTSMPWHGAPRAMAAKIISYTSIGNCNSVCMLLFLKCQLFIFWFNWYKVHSAFNRTLLLLKLKLNNDIMVLFIAVFSDEMLQLVDFARSRLSFACFPCIATVQWKPAWHVPERFYCTTHIQQNKPANSKETRDSVVLKTPILGGLRSFKVIDDDIPKKLFTSACYDEQHVCVYLQLFPC